MEKFKFLEHTADIKFQAFGKNIEEVFSNSALAMFNSMFDGKVKEKIKKEINVSGKDNESLLYNFLEELLFLFDSEGFFLSKVEKIKIVNGKLIANVVGNVVGKKIKIDIKAVTYHDMYVKQEGNKWIAQVVLDV